MRFARIAAFTMFFTLNGHLSFAHEDGFPNWITEKFMWCCGPQDCSPIAVDAYEIRDDGVWLPDSQELIPLDKVLQSQDFRPWRCQYLQGEMAGKTRCLFLPGAS